MRPAIKAEIPQFISCKLLCGHTKKTKHNEEFDTANMCIYSGKIGGRGLNSELRAGRGDRLTVRPLHRTPKLYIFCGLEATK